MSHPPHLMSDWSSAFIPFCAYKTDLNFSEKSSALNGTDFPLCSSFLPTILEGQLCYKLTLNKTSGKGKKNELMILLDYNEDLALQTLSNGKKASKTSNKTLDLDTAVGSIQGSSAKVQINTLSTYIGFGGGSYQMTDVKRMTAKEDFLKMPLKDRNCEVELYEDCRTRELFEHCGCAPWEMSFFQVCSFSKNINYLSSRTWRYVIQKGETASRRTLLRLSTAAQLVLESMLMFGLRKQ